MANRRQIEIDIENNARSLLTKLGEHNFLEYLKDGNFIYDKYRKQREIKDSIIDKMAGTIFDTHFMKSMTNKETIINEYRQQVLKEIEGGKNDK